MKCIVYGIVAYNVLFHKVFYLRPFDRVSRGRSWYDFTAKRHNFWYSVLCNPPVYISFIESYAPALSGLYLEMRYLLIAHKFINGAFRKLEISRKPLFVKDGIHCFMLALTGDNGLQHIHDRPCYGLYVFRLKLCLHLSPLGLNI